MFHHHPFMAAALALPLGLALAACGTPGENRSLYSVNQPVVERSAHSLDLQAGAAGLAPGEAQRLGDWFAALDLGSGDEVALTGASDPVRGHVAALLGAHGLVLAADARGDEGLQAGGPLRVTVTRARALVPDCPNWSSRTSGNYGNATSSNYGCAINANLAAMIANPAHLLEGEKATGSSTGVGVKAIEVHRNAIPTGAAGLPQISSSEN